MPSSPSDRPSGLGLRFENVLATPRDRVVDAPPVACRTAPWGNIWRAEPKAARRELKVLELVRPAVELHDERSFVRVLVHLPGVREAELRLAVRGDLLSLWTEPSRPAARRCETEVVFPFPVASEARRRTFKNGILGLEFTRDEPGPGHES